MWGKILGFFLSLFEMWSKLPENTKEKIIDSIVEMFSEVFRQQYKASKNDSGKESEKV
jgi:hypothetical protein